MNDIRSQLKAGSSNAEATACQDGDWLTQIVRGWARAIELRDWEGFRQMVNLEEIYFFGQPTSIDDTSQTLANAFNEVCDFEIVQHEIDRKRLGDGKQRISVVLNLFWTTLDDWDERHAEVVVHAVFHIRRATWTAVQVVVDRHVHANLEAPVAHAPAPRELPDPLMQNTVAPVAPPRPGAQGTPVPVEAAADQKVQYFAAQAPFAVPQAPPLESTERSRHVVYMPVVLDRETLRAILGS